MERLRIHIIGGSIASKFGIKDESWPELFAAELSNKAVVTHEIQNGLNFSRAIPHIAQSDQVGILILHFGIAVGWPVSFRKVDIKFGTTPLKNEYAYHQPAGKGRNFPRRVKNRIKFRVRNGIKYLLFLSGQYKPRVSASDLEDQVAAVLSVAHTRAKEIVWIQHVPAWSMRTLVERWYYKSYIARIKSFAQKHAQSDVTFVIPEEPLTDARYYLLDTTHLNSAGHRAYSEMVLSLPVIQQALL